MINDILLERNWNEVTIDNNVDSTHFKAYYKKLGNITILHLQIEGALITSIGARLGNINLNNYPMLRVSMPLYVQAGADIYTGSTTHSGRTLTSLVYTTSGNTATIDAYPAFPTQITGSCNVRVVGSIFIVIH